MASALALSFLFTFTAGCGGAENKGGSTDSTVKDTAAHKAAPLAPVNRELTDAARLLAGFPVDSSSPLNAVSQTAQFKSHQAVFAKRWDDLTQKQFNKVRTWAAAELDALPGAGGNIFYPFGGPDFLYINTLFPKGNSYTLTGLEPVGEVPPLASLSPAQLGTSFSMIDRVLNDILGYSFFRTIDMEADFRSTSLKGVIPVLMVFLVVKENEIVALDYVGMTDGGELKMLSKEEFAGLNGKMIPGVQITFRKKGDDHDRYLRYFSTDISNEGLAKTPQYGEYVKKLNGPITYLKAASYLMHRETFSTVRNLILDNSTAVLQDDSGMPVKHFQDGRFTNTFYGLYTEPIALFSSRYQADLRKIYTDGQGIKPLDFGIGYQYKVSNLMLAVKK